MLSRFSEANFRALAENAPEAIFVINNEGIFDYVNERACELLGYSGAELLGRHFTTYIHPYDVPLVSERWQARRRGQKVPERHEIQLVRKDGVHLPIEMSVTLIQWEGETATLALAHDISPRRELEKALGTELRLRATLAELSKSLLSAFDLEQLSEITLQEAQQFTQSPFGFIGYLNQDNDREFIGVMLRSEPQKGAFERYVDTFERMKTFWEWVTREDKTLLFNDIEQNSTPLPLHENHSPIQRLILAPAKINGNVVGILAVANAPNPYLPAHAELLERFADLYALALQRHWQEETLRQESHRAANLAEIGQQIVACQRELPLLLETISRQTATALQATCLTFVCEPADNTMRLAAFSHPDPLLLSLLNHSLDLLPFSAAQTPWCEVLQDRQPRYFRQAHDSHPAILTIPPLQQINDLIGIHSLLILPLNDSNTLLGLMILCRHKDNSAFTAADFQFAQEVAARLSLGMMNARLVSDLESQQVLLEARVSERTAELQAEREFVLQVINSIDVGITVVGADRRFAYVNRAFAEMLGYTPQELVGRKPHEIAIPPHKIVLESQWKNRLQGKQTSYENILLHKDGTPIPVLITGIPRRQGDKISGSIAVITDLRQRKLLEEEQFWLQGFRDLLLSIAHTFIEGATLQDQALIERLLGEVGKFLAVDRVYLFIFDWQHNTMSNTHEWVAEGVSSEKENLQNIPNDSIPVWVDTLRNEAYLLVPDVPALSGEWSNVKTILQAQAIQSLLVVPIRSGENLYGFVGFDSVKEKRQWKEEEIYLLTILANQFASLFVRQAAEETLRQSEARYRLLAENVSDVIWTTDLNFNYTYISPSITTLTGYSVEEAMQLRLNEILTPASYRATKEALAQEMRKLATLPPEGKRTWSHTMEVEYRCKDGTTRWMEVKVSHLWDTQGNAIGFLGMSRDVSERRQTRQILEYMATHDELTGLPNRYLFNDRLKHALKRAAREKRSLAVFLIDLDHFKELNDTLGHHKGDLVLQEVARRLLGVLRQSDTVARMGGDEFCVILEDLTQPEDAAQVARKLLQAIAKPYAVDENVTWSLSTSIGISIYPLDGDNAETLMICADIAMYRAKKRRNRYRFYSLPRRKLQN
ncbi:MAG: hypothetical protein Kow0088_09720 [Anaerolineales bacterium]